MSRDVHRPKIIQFTHAQFHQALVDGPPLHGLSVVAAVLTAGNQSGHGVTVVRTRRALFTVDGDGPASTGYYGHDVGRVGDGDVNGQVGDVGAAVRATAGGALLNEEHLSGFEGELLGYDNADQGVADGEIPSCLP